MKRFIASTYQKVYKVLPERGKVIASQLVSRLGRKPFVYFDPAVHPAERLTRGAVSFSIDFELAWAWQYARNLRESAVAMGLRERDQVPVILAELDRYGIPATWATVGHLFLERCGHDSHGLAHSEMPRLQHFESEFWRFQQGDWFQHDPCTNVKKDPAWYAPDLIEQILSSKTNHEIACHGFSHAGFGTYCPAEVATAEIDACLGVMQKFGVRPTSLVFPGNDAGHLSVIASRGFKAVRAFPHELAEISLPVRGKEGLWMVHDSAAIDVEGKSWNLESRLQRLKDYVDTAAETRLAAHIWLHPSLPSNQMRGLLFPLLKYCNEMREKGLIGIYTMESLVAATAQLSRKEVHA